MNTKTPVAIFTYNRPEHARQLFLSLLNCARLEECKIYIYCDGARKPEHVAGVLVSRQVVHEFAPRLNNACVIEHEENIGVDHSIVNGVTELCTKYGRVVVLEDDVMLHPLFLDFMLQSLDRYADDEEVAQVAGYLAPIHPEVEADTFFLPLTTSCGWATWKRAWELFSWDIELALAELSVDSHLRARFDLDGVYPYYALLQSTEREETDIWDIRWYWHTFRQEKLTLYPHRSLVWVGGFDNLATHTKSEEIPMFYDQSFDFILQGNWNNSVSFPDITQTDAIAFNKLKNLILYNPSRALLVRLKGKLRRILTWLVK
jgi:hypothetical protein